jgi:hypothetical protein
MSRPTRATPRYAARCAERIDLLPSRRLVACAFLWLALTCGAVFASSLPWVTCLAICVPFAAWYARCVRSAVQHRGRHAIQAVGWSEEGLLVAWTASRTGPLQATIAPGSFRLGSSLLVLTLDTHDKRHALLVDAHAHDPAAFRRLCRHLQGVPQRRSRRARSPS